MRIAIYARISEDRNGEELGVDRQTQACEACAVQRWGGEAAISLYVDNDKSATSGKPRPEFERLLADVGAGRVDVIVTWSPDRFIRRPVEYERVIDLVEKLSVQLVALHGQDVDLTTPYGRAVARIFGAIARQEVEQKAVRQRAANRQRAQRGVMLWTRRPFGFDRDGRDVSIVETEAAEICKATASLLEGATLAEVARDLNARGVTTSLGRQWSIKTVKQVLLNPRVAGRVVYRGEDMGQRGPAILDAETYDRLHALLTDPRRKHAPSTTVKYLLSGIARCGRDGCDLASMLATTNGGERTHVYRCRRCYLTRHRERVDEVVMAVLVARLSRPDAVQLLSPDVDVTELRRKAVELRERRDGLAALLADGLLSPDAVRTQAKRLGTQLEDLERQIDAATGGSPLADVVAAEDVAAALDALPLLRVREIVRTLMDVVILPAGKGVRFSPEQVQIEWKAQS